VAAVVTSRVAVILAAGSPAARPGGFGALIAGATTARARAIALVALLAVVGAGGAATGGISFAGRGLAAVVAGLLAAALLHRGARRRLGGMTGDVFGALIEVSTAVVLLVLALW
jgi:adenosylcobinamide-GDP ribazoletransferase